MAKKKTPREIMYDDLYSRSDSFPIDFEWYVLDCLPKYIFRYSKKKYSECFCPECDSTFMKDDAIGGKDAFCPICGYKGKYKYMNQNKGYVDKVNVAIAETTSDGNKAITILKCRREYYINSVKHYVITADDLACIYFSGNDIRRYKVYSAYSHYSDYHPLPYGYIFDSCYVHKSVGELFPEYSMFVGNNLELDCAIYNKITDGYKPNLNNYYRFYNVSSNMKGALKHGNANYPAYRLLQMNHIDTTAKCVNEFSELNWYNNTFDADILKYMSFDKMIRYCSSQIKNIKDNYISSRKYRIFPYIVNTYTDYIRMAELDGLNINLKAIRFPRDLFNQHDAILTEHNIKVKENVIKYAAKFWKKNGVIYSDKKYSVIIPTTKEEFVAEGKVLNHCVGRMPGYFENQFKGKKMIFFIRNKNKLKIPYFTMEADLVNHKIIQLYGFCDCSAPSLVREFAEKFLDYYISTTFIAEKSTNLANVG